MIYRAVIVMSGVLLLGGIPGCTSSGAEPAAKKKPGQSTPAQKTNSQTVNVKVAVVEVSSITEKISSTGVTTADADLMYSAETAGQVEYLRVELGQRIRRGQVLARIDYQSLKARAEEAAARFELQVKTGRRLKALKKDDLVPQDQLDQAEASRVAAGAQLKIARANLGKSVIRARRAGVVTQKLVNQGEYVAPGARMLQVVDHRVIVVEGQLSESQVSRVKPGAVARVSIKAMGKEFAGKVHVVIPVSDPKSKTFTVRVKVPNKKFEIMVGMAATIRIDVGRHDKVVMVPQDVVVDDGSLHHVFVEKDGVAQKRTVKLGPVDRQSVALMEGVVPGERLVVLGHRGLQDGQRVRVVK